MAKDEIEYKSPEDVREEKLRKKQGQAYDKAITSEGMKCGGKVKKMASGGLTGGHKSADGIARKGKTKGKEVKMAYGGKC